MFVNMLVNSCCCCCKCEHKISSVFNLMYSGQLVLFYMYVCLFVHQSLRLSHFPSICSPNFLPSLNQLVCPSICPSIISQSINQYVGLSVHPSVCPFVLPFVDSSFCLPLQILQQCSNTYYCKNQCSHIKKFLYLNPRSTTANAPENDYMSDVDSQSSRMYRSISGQSLGELESQHQDQAKQVEHFFQQLIKPIVFTYRELGQFLG